MLILHRYVLREGLLASLTSLSVLLGVISALFLAELLADAAQGELPGGSVVLLLLLRLPEAALMVGPLALLTGLLLALGRLHEHSEMTVLRAAGIGLARCHVAVAILVSGWALCLLLVSGWLAPFALERTGELMADAARQAVVAGLQPGQFERFDSGRLTVYVGGVDAAAGELSDVLIQHADPEQPEILSASRGRLWLDSTDGSRYLSLLDGHQVRHGHDPVTAPLRDLRFARNDIRLPTPDLGAGVDGEMVSRLPQLWPPATPAERREWQWRVAAPLAALILGALAVPLSHRSPRQGRWGSLVVALGLYLVYSNAIQAGLVMMEQRDALSGPGLWPVHGVVALAAFGLFILHRHRW